jgi:hypothetical protein
MVAKNKDFPEIDLSHLPKLRELMDFDEHYTSKIHGFLNAQDYYAQANCKQFLSKIRTPSILINALDDPFLTTQCMPYVEAEQSEYFHFLGLSHGGHVGFARSWYDFDLEHLIDLGIQILK